MCTTLIPSSMRLARIALDGPVMVDLLAEASKTDTGDVAVNFIAATVLAAISLNWLDIGVGRTRRRRRIEYQKAMVDRGRMSA